MNKFIFPSGWLSGNDDESLPLEVVSDKEGLTLYQFGSKSDEGDAVIVTWEQLAQIMSAVISKS